MVTQSSHLTGDGHIVHPPTKEPLPTTGIEPTQFWNSASKVAGLQGRVTTNLFL